MHRAMDGESPVSMGLAYGPCAHLGEAGSPGGALSNQQALPGKRAA